MAGRAVEDLSEAKIVVFDSASEEKTISPEAEAHIMTRHLVTFKTMCLLMSLPKTCNISKVRSEV